MMVPHSSAGSVSPGTMLGWAGKHFAETGVWVKSGGRLLLEFYHVAHRPRWYVETSKVLWSFALITYEY